MQFSQRIHEARTNSSKCRWGKPREAEIWITDHHHHHHHGETFKRMLMWCWCMYAYLCVWCQGGTLEGGEGPTRRSGSKSLGHANPTMGYRVYIVPWCVKKFPGPHLKSKRHSIPLLTERPFGLNGYPVSFESHRGLHAEHSCACATPYMYTR